MNGQGEGIVQTTNAYKRRRKPKWYENPLGAIPCRFESGRPHQPNPLVIPTSRTRDRDLKCRPGQTHRCMLAKLVLSKPSMPSYLRGVSVSITVLQFGSCMVRAR